LLLLVTPRDVVVIVFVDVVVDVIVVVNVIAH